MLLDFGFENSANMSLGLTVGRITGVVNMQKRREGDIVKFAREIRMREASNAFEKSV
jgi:hypothetical protein